MSITAAAFADTGRSLSADPHSAMNRALVVGVSHGLPGIHADVVNINTIATNVAHGFQSTTLEGKYGTKANILAQLTKLSSEADQDGTFLFYFSGHGGRGTLRFQDVGVSIKTLRAALEKGRENLGPLGRLVLIFDSCYSGSLAGGVRARESLADEVFRAFSEPSENRRVTYWDELFVFASSRANEMSSAGPSGSGFTLAFVKAYKEVSQMAGTFLDLITRTKRYTKSHHPEARLVPEDLANEPLL